MSFQPAQIVRLAQNRTQLYAEVIDHIAQRDLLWARPLLLVTDWPGENSTIELLDASQVKDLREEAHLLWPVSLFSAVLDMEILPLLPYLYGPKPAAPGDSSAAAALRQFMGELWSEQANGAGP